MKRLLSMIGLCLTFSGCTISDNFSKTLFVEPWQYCDYFDAQRAHSRHCRLAKDAWSKIQHKRSMKRVSHDYARGFREGFTDFLDAGGTGQPPALPPRRYWNDRYASPPGRQAVQDWFAGFRHGAAMARASGAREFAMVPLSTPVASINGMYVNRQTGPTPVTILTPPIPDPALMPPGSRPGAVLVDPSQLPDATRPFGLLPGTLPSHNLPPSTLPPGTSPPGVEPVIPGETSIESFPSGGMPAEVIPPGGMLANPPKAPRPLQPDGLLPEPLPRGASTRGISTRNDRGESSRRGFGKTLR
jgi:hypothetical protein